MRKLLILLGICALSTVAGCDNREPIEPEGNLLFVDLAVVVHESYDQVAEACEVEVAEDEQLEGCAMFIWEHGIVSDCEVHIVQPRHVDDEHTLTLGHEVLHCMYGLYHE